MTRPDIVIAVEVVELYVKLRSYRKTLESNIYKTISYLNGQITGIVYEVI